MDNSLKIGIVTGLIAGLIAGLVAVFVTIPLSIKLGLPYMWTPLPPETPFTKIAMVEFTIVLIWGIILGIIYSRIQDLIPGNRILKGLLFGLAYYLILSIRNATFSFAYGAGSVFRDFLFLHPIIYGLVLGILYKAPKEKLKIKKHEIMSGVIPGAITGFIFAIAVIIAFIIGTYLGVVFGFSEFFPDYLADIEFIIYQFGSHGWINMLWYTVFGAFYAEFYDRIPGKALVKASVYGLIIWLITSIPNGLLYFAHGELGVATQWGLFGPMLYIFGGLLLEGIYKKRRNAILMACVAYIIGILIRFVISTMS